MRVLITGVAGFIGNSLAMEMLIRNYYVIGIDNVNSYYSESLKLDRLNRINHFKNFEFFKTDIIDLNSLKCIFDKCKPDIVIHLAAQAGVRYSIENPFAYVDSNLIGFVNILEMCRNYKIEHFIYASSSSVYGSNQETPFSTNHNVDHPISLYAATKKANELMAHTYSHLYGIPTTGLRFFTVYGPWGRPDMAYFSFAKNIYEEKPIRVFNNGDMERDFTYIDDIVQGIIKIIDVVPEPNPEWNEKMDSISSSFAPYKIYNIGNSSPVRLMKFIEILEKKIGKKANIQFLEMQPGDVLKTYADVSDLEKAINFKPSTSLDSGLEKFIDWYKRYYNAK